MRRIGKLRLIFALTYVVFILWLTIFCRTSGNERIFRGLFWEMQMGYWSNIVLNTLLFIPLGFLLGDIGWKAILIGFVLSVSIELIQYFAMLGFCEVDDVLNNTIGTVVGMVLSSQYVK